MFFFFLCFRFPLKGCRFGGLTRVKGGTDTPPHSLPRPCSRPSRTQIAILYHIKHFSVRNGQLFDTIAYSHLHSGTQIACCCSRWLGKWLLKSSTVCDDAAMIRCYFFVPHHPSFWLLHQSEVSLKHLLFVVGIVKLAVCSRLVLQSL